MNRQNMGRNKMGMSLPNAHSDPKELRAEQGQLVELPPPAGPVPPQRSQTPNVQPQLPSGLAAAGRVISDTISGRDDKAAS